MDNHENLELRIKQIEENYQNLSQACLEKFGHIINKLHELEAKVKLMEFPKHFTDPNIVNECRLLSGEVNIV